ncbi:MAG: hypothetical protein J5I94_00220, partial [Phaeodactylibacter sp.]|nr:hypothetical protein [Phaeodactylibacter sp.]
ECVVCFVVLTWFWCLWCSFLEKAFWGFVGCKVRLFSGPGFPFCIFPADTKEERLSDLDIVGWPEVVLFVDSQRPVCYLNGTG